jgi:hypothetical protein
VLCETLRLRAISRIGCASITPLDRLLLLVRGQRRLTPNPLTLRHGTGAAFTGPGADQLALNLSQVAQHDQHEAVVGRVAPAYVPPRDLKLAFLQAIAAKVLSNSGVERARRSNPVTMGTSPTSSWAGAVWSWLRPVFAQLATSEASDVRRPPRAGAPGRQRSGSSFEARASP